MSQPRASVGAQSGDISGGNDCEIEILSEMLGHAVGAVEPGSAHRASLGLPLSVVIEAATRLVEQAAERAVAVGQQTYRTDLGFIRLVMSKMGALPGQRILILISPGFLTPSEEAMALASQVLEMAARDNIIINAIDSRGLYTTNLESSERGGGTPLASRVQSQHRPVSMTADEGVMADLADGSGGTYLHGRNDLEAGLTRLFSEPKYLYLLAFSVAKPNGAYHELKVRVNHDGLTVQARRGYVALKSQSAK